MAAVLARRAVAFGLLILLSATTGNSNAQTSGSTETATGRAHPEVRALLVPRVSSTLSSELNGRVVDLPVEEGKRFEEGDLLVSFDCTINRLQMQRAEADLRGKLQTHASNVKLLKLEAVSDLEVAISRAEADMAHADLQLSEAQVDMCEIHAPYAGRVVKRHVNVHETVTAGQPIVDILDDSRLRMELYIPSHWLSWIDLGTKLEVRMDETAKNYPAVVTALGAQVDAASQTLAITAELLGDHGELLSGMSGAAKFDVP